MQTVSSAAFDQVSIEMGHLTEWAGLSSAATIDKDDGGRDATGLQIVLHDPTEWTGVAHSVKLSQIVRRSISGKADHEQRLYELSVRTVATFSFQSPITLEDCWRAPIPLRQLLTIAVGGPCETIRQTVRLETGSECRLYFRRPKSVSRPVSAEWYRYAFSLADCAFAEVYESWLDLRFRCKSAVDILDSTISDRPAVYQNTIMNAMMSVEDFHRRLFPGEEPREDDSRHYSAVLSKSQEFLESDELEWLQGSIMRPGVGFKERAKTLALVPDEKASIALLGDFEVWAKYAKEARNAIAHSRLYKLDKLPENVRIRIGSIAIELLRLVVMEKIGLGSEIQQRHVRDNCWLLADGFHGLSSQIPD